MLLDYGDVELWQAGLDIIDAVVTSAFEVYEEVIAKKNAFHFHHSITKNAIELYRNWLPYSVLLFYQTKEKEIIATSCLTRKVDGICFLIDDEYLRFKKENGLASWNENFYFGSLTAVNKKKLSKASTSKGLSFEMYKQMNIILASLVLRDNNAVYLADFEETALLLINRSLHMKWEPIGKPTQWLGSKSTPAYISLKNLKEWFTRHKSPELQTQDSRSFII